MVLAVLAVLGIPIGLLTVAVVYSVKKHSKPRHVDAESLRSCTVSKDSLFSIFQPHLVDMNEIQKRGYSSVLSIVQHMIGVQPSCDTVLEIWPPCFQCYNIIVPNYLNFPQAIFNVPGSLDTRLTSLAMYASSRANQCAYCTSHSCSFAVRRGVNPNALKNLLEDLHSPSKVLTPKEQVVVQLAYGLGTVPVSLTVDIVNKAFKHFSKSELEWLVAATAMFGAFNKLMDGLNIPLEADTYYETVALMDNQYSIGEAAGTMLSKDNKENKLPPPPVDNWTNYLDILYQGLRPGGALALDAKLLKGVPDTTVACQDHLKNLCGSKFQAVLESLEHARFRRAVTGVISKNMVSANLPLSVKAQAGIQYCKNVLNNLSLANELEQVLRFCCRTTKEASPLVLRVSKALSYTPSRMHAGLVEEIRESEELTPGAVVELVSFLAAIQMMHRIVSYNIVLQKAMA